MNIYVIWVVKMWMVLVWIFGRYIIYNMYNLFFGGKSSEFDGVDF